MRPSDSGEELELYECVDCGERVEDPDSQLCGDCGGELIHLGRSRDL